MANNMDGAATVALRAILLGDDLHRRVATVRKFAHAAPVALAMATRAACKAAFSVL